MRLCNSPPRALVTWHLGTWASWHLGSWIPKTLSVYLCGDRDLSSLPLPELMYESLYLNSFLLPSVIIEILHRLQSHLSNQTPVPVPCQRLCKRVGNHLFCWTVYQLDLAHFNTFPDEMILNIDVLCPRMVLWVVCQCNGSLISSSKIVSQCFQ